MKLIEPLYKIEVELRDYEERIINFSEFKRLRHIFHAGIHAFISPLRHTRFEHSIGCFVLTKFFGLGEEIQLTALLHDIGHLTFSHSSEQAFRKGIHHEITENLILNSPIAEVLKGAGFNPQRIVKLVKSWPLESKDTRMNLDHLDCFLRDTYYLNLHKIQPQLLIRKISLDEERISSTNKRAVEEIMRLCIEDNKRMASTDSIVSNCLGIEVFKMAKEFGVIDLKSLAELTEYEVLSEMLSSNKKRLRELVRDILFNLERYRALKVGKSSFRLKLYLENIFLRNKRADQLFPWVKKEFVRLKQKEGYYKAIKTNYQNQ